MTQSPCCWKAKWVTLRHLCKSSQDGLGQLPCPGQQWEWEVLDLGTGEIGSGLTDSSTTTTLGALITATALSWEKLTACKCNGVTLDQKCAEMHQPLQGRVWGVSPEPELRGEVRSSSSSTQHHSTSRECQRTAALDCPQAGTESHFTFLNNSETNTQTQTYFGHSQRRSGPRRRKQISILLTPNWFYDSVVRHYSTSLEDIHDLILQKLPHFLGQSPNIIF